MIEIETFSNGEKEVSSDFLPTLTLIRNAEEHKKMAGWNYYMDEPSYPCWMLEVEYRCDSSYYYFTAEELQQLLDLLKEAKT